ncbi:MAG: glycosyltransferase family 4 protein, partial [Candidatus Nanopelagicaceae bacterium]
FEVEGLGIVYLEASSCALPVIVGRSGGAPDALLHGETGLLVDGKDVQEVAAACIELLSDPVRASEMGAKGRAWTATQWNWDRWAGEFQASLLR